MYIYTYMYIYMYMYLHIYNFTIVHKKILPKVSCKHLLTYFKIEIYN